MVFLFEKKNITCKTLNILQVICIINIFTGCDYQVFVSLNTNTKTKKLLNENYF